MDYDSKIDTERHIEEVREQLNHIFTNLTRRAAFHDASKFFSPEKEMFDEMTPKLRAFTYGSDQYKDCLQQMGPALKHHYEVNSHHPEHYENGVQGMSLLDILEMLADWRAASKRHADGSFHASLKINKERFNISDELFAIMMKTVEELGW